ncbi:MAG: hypothetical protein V4687_03280 [Bacteroidota bacterium]
MKPLIVLLSVFLIAGMVLRAISGDFDIGFAGRIAMSVMLFFTAGGHFAFSKGMEMMVPPFIPFKRTIVYLTGIIEIAGAIGLLIPNVQKLVGLLLIAFFIILLPANVYAATRKVDYQKANFNGSGLNYLWFRVPLQLLFILWVYFSAVYIPNITA